MSTDEISTWLEQGLEAAASGDRAFAREQLRRVVEADEHNLQAWLALNEVAATLEDREECLQHILKIDPNYAGTRQQLSEVQARLATVDVAEVEEDLSPLAISEAASHPIGPSLDFSTDQLTDPLLCVYCAYPTREEDRTCPHCHRKLYEAFYENEKPRWIALGWIVSVGDVLYNLAVMGAVLFFISIALASIHAGDRVDVGQLLLFYSGQPNNLSPQVQTLVLNVLPRDFFYFRLGYIILITIVAFGMLTRRRVWDAVVAGLGLTLSALGFGAIAAVSPRPRLGAGRPLPSTPMRPRPTFSPAVPNKTRDTAERPKRPTCSICVWLPVDATRPSSGRS